MADTKTYTVHRSMHADGRDYARGDTREMSEIDAAPLVQSGALSFEGEPPRDREPAVRHAFGTAEVTGHINSTTATTDDDAPSVRRAPAKAKA